MRKAGEVMFADVFQEGGHSKGCGVVEYATEAEAQKAIASLNDTTLEGTDRPIFVREDRIANYDGGFRGRGRGRGMMGFPMRGRGYMVRGQPMMIPNGRGMMMGGRGMMLPNRGMVPHRGPLMRGGPMMFPRGGYMMPPGPIMIPPGMIPPGQGGYPYHPMGPVRPRGTGPVVEGSRANRQIFVGNLPYHTSWQDLKDLFNEVGTILRADIIVGPDGRSKGMGTVCFETEESAQKAIEKMNEFELEGRVIHVSKDKFAK